MTPDSDDLDNWAEIHQTLLRATGGAPHPPRTIRTTVADYPKSERTGLIIETSFGPAVIQGRHPRRFLPGTFLLETGEQIFLDYAVYASARVLGRAWNPDLTPIH